MSKVHMVLQAKGGIGKSLISSLIAQYLKQKTSNLLVIDIDQENPTLSQYKDLNVQKISVMGDGRAIDPKKFDVLMNSILEHEGDIVVDTGANTFSALMAYVIENGVFEIIEASGKTLVVHTVIGGGDCMYDTANGFADIASYVNGNIVLWLNEHFGSLESTTGVKWDDSKVLAANKDKVLSTILLQKRTAATFGSDINKMTSARLTFDEVDASNKFGAMEKNRLKIVRKAVFDQLDQVAM
jgi:hypothetical protein